MTDLKRYMLDRILEMPKVEPDVKALVALAEEYIHRAKYPETIKSFVDEYLHLSCGLEPREILSVLGNMEKQPDINERARRLLGGDVDG